MRLVVQRVSRAEVLVAGERVAAMGAGLLVLCGFGLDDGPGAPGTSWWKAMVAKLLELRIFSDAGGKMNVSLADVDGGVLLVSQFTLYGDCRRGRRPSFSGAAAPEVARALFDRLRADVETMLPGRVGAGVFGADMDVSLTNHGPVTLILDSRDFV